jgi:hypothetical protein
MLPDRKDGRIALPRGGRMLAIRNQKRAGAPPPRPPRGTSFSNLVVPAFKLTFRPNSPEASGAGDRGIASGNDSHLRSSLLLASSSDLNPSVGSQNSNCNSVLAPGDLYRRVPQGRVSLVLASAFAGWAGRKICACQLSAATALAPSLPRAFLSKFGRFLVTILILLRNPNRSETGCRLCSILNRLS